MIHDVVVEEKRYTGNNAPRDSFRIIGAYSNHSDAYMADTKIVLRNLGVLLVSL